MCDAVYVMKCASHYTSSQTIIAYWHSQSVYMCPDVPDVLHHPSCSFCALCCEDRSSFISTQTPELWSSQAMTANQERKWRRIVISTSSSSSPPTLFSRSLRQTDNSAATDGQLRTRRRLDYREELQSWGRVFYLGTLQAIMSGV